MVNGDLKRVIRQLISFQDNNRRMRQWLKNSRKDKHLPPILPAGRGFTFVNSAKSQEMRSGVDVFVVKC